MVVLVGDVDNATATLTRGDATTISEVINTTRPLSCYRELYGFDIESNGSVGTLAVPGELRHNGSETEICSTDQFSSELICR